MRALIPDFILETSFLKLGETAVIKFTRPFEVTVPQCRGERVLMPESLVLALIKGKVGGSRWHLEEPFVPVWYEGLH